MIEASDVVSAVFHPILIFHPRGIYQVWYIFSRIRHWSQELKAWYHLVSLVNGSCEVDEEKQNGLCQTTSALVWLGHLDKEGVEKF